MTGWQKIDRAALLKLEEEAEQSLRAALSARNGLIKEAAWMTQGHAWWQAAALRHRGALVDKELGLVVAFESRKKAFESVRTVVRKRVTLLRALRGAFECAAADEFARRSPAGCLSEQERT